MRIFISNKRTRFVPAALVVAAMAITVLMGVAGCGEEEEAAVLMKVAASTVPMADFCAQVGGDLVEVETMVPPGASPHTYEPTTRQMKFMRDAKVFVQNGLNLEAWAADTLKKVDNPDLVVVVASDDVPKSDLVEVKEGVYDPHVWLDPNLAIYEVEAIRNGFIKADPENEDTYEKNARRYREELEELDRYVKGETSRFAVKKFVSFHPAFRYYAARYGLEQVGSIEEVPGKEPSVGEIATLVDLMRSEDVTVVFTEPQFDPRAAAAVAAEAGANVVLRSLDSLGNPDDPETCTYIKLIKHDTGVMAEVMK